MLRIALCLVFTIFSTTPLALSAQTTGEVDLLWRGETYTPPFYKGLPLWSNESTVTLTAIPHISGRNSSSLYYRWSQDGVVRGNLSGVGKNSIEFTDSVLSLPMSVKIDVRDGEEGDILATKTVSLRPQTPKVYVVEDNPLYGIMFNKTISNEVVLDKDEITFVAIPLFSSVTYRAAPSMTYTWSTNSGETTVGDKVTFRAPEGTTGFSSVKLRTLHSRTLTQPKKLNFLIQFGEDTGF